MSGTLSRVGACLSPSFAFLNVGRAASQRSGETGRSCHHRWHCHGPPASDAARTVVCRDEGKVGMGTSFANAVVLLAIGRRELLAVRPGGGGAHPGTDMGISEGWRDWDGARELQLVWREKWGLMV